MCIVDKKWETLIDMYLSIRNHINESEANNKSKEELKPFEEDLYRTIQEDSRLSINRKQAEFLFDYAVQIYNDLAWEHPEEERGAMFELDGHYYSQKAEYIDLVDLFSTVDSVIQTFSDFMKLS